jgi:hypothetical protein
VWERFVGFYTAGFRKVRPSAASCRATVARTAVYER